MVDDPAVNRSAACHAGEEGLALLIAIIALSLFLILGLYLAFNAAIEVRIGDNYESEIRAGFAARAGLNHARELLKGLPFDDLLKGSDGTYDASPDYVREARSFGYRNPLGWSAARSLDIFDPSAAVDGIPDDGLINTGRIGTVNGTALIPLTGIAQIVPDPRGAGPVIISRYFVKVADNNSERSELAKDAADNPFADGDGIIIARSVGISSTMRDTTASTVYRNSVSVVEARFQRLSTFDLEAALVIECNDVQASFHGNAFQIAGGPEKPGIGLIDTHAADDIDPLMTVRGAAGSNGRISGGGDPEPSIRDITSMVTADPDKALLLDAGFLGKFTAETVPRFADRIYVGNQAWTEASAPYLGRYDAAIPLNDPSQDPLVTLVNGDLAISGNIGGGGLLVVTGALSLRGRLNYQGLILVIGAGSVDAAGWEGILRGGMYLANLDPAGGGTPVFSMGGSGSLQFNATAVKMAVGLMPVAQIGWREVTRSMDP